MFNNVLQPKPICAAPLGIIMLECKFPRLPGDIGNIATFPFPVQYEVLFDINFEDLIHREVKYAKDALLYAAQRLERMGVKSIITSCGLLLKYQRLLSEKCNIPVATSSVLLLPSLIQIIGDKKKILVICSDSKSLSASDIERYTSISINRFDVYGLEECNIFNDTFNIWHGDTALPHPHIDKSAVYSEIKNTLRSMIKRETEYGAILLECTNLGPYKESFMKDFNIPVFDFLSLSKLLYSGTYL